MAALPEETGEVAAGGEGGEGGREIEEEGDRDSLVPGTGSIAGHLEERSDDEEDEGAEEDEDGAELEESEENMSNVVQGTTESILNKLEENLSQVLVLAVA
jgi:hypothetical protein